jgi:anaerobic nitric oxide reductase flavorubredoxin
MNKVTIAEDIFWVGVVDWNIRDFHGYTTSRGTTYNAYLILDQKTVLVDTVKHTFGKELLRNVCDITGPEKIDYIIVNHVEMDHSSGLPMMAEKAKNATIIASQKGKEAIICHYGDHFKNPNGQDRR